MKKFCLVSNFSIDNLGNKKEVQSLLSRLEIDSDNHVVLDLSGCMIDYPTTSLIIDHILFQLYYLTGTKFLQIKTDLNLPIQPLMTFLFMGSKYFSFDVTWHKSKEEYLNKIETKASKDNLKMEIFCNHKCVFYT